MWWSTVVQRCGLIASGSHFYPREMHTMTPCTIWLSAVAQRYGLFTCGCPFYTGDVFCHHIVIIMETEDDKLAKIITNNQSGLTA